MEEVLKTIEVRNFKEEIIEINIHHHYLKHKNYSDLVKAIN